MIIEMTDEPSMDVNEAPTSIETPSDNLKEDYYTKHEQVDQNFHGKYNFRETHPLHTSHMIQIAKEQDACIPNFVGGSLPRKDCGDREYYCCTMLTLFKPWRKGHDLKMEHSSWDETFTNHPFTSRQNDIIKFFNIRYECLDAKDDFFKQRTKADAGVINGWLPNDDDNLSNDCIENANIQGIPDDYADGDYDMELLTHLGESGVKDLMASHEIDNIMRKAGWLDAIIDGILPLDSVNMTEANVQSTAHWKNVLQIARDAVINKREAMYASIKKKGIPLNTKHKHNQVEIVDASYLTSSYKCENPLIDTLIIDTINKFTLNKEQKRAFHIVANHATNINAPQLKMYMGGMGGTGKSQVIKALIHFFKERGESHRFITLAPTGSAAALIDGSTYHHALGINSTERHSESIATLTEIRSRLRGVEYIFIDEISMVSCHDMYKISAQLARVMNEYVKPFGGQNIIFSGDFAQLKPVRQRALYNHAVGTHAHSGMSIHGQEEAIGKSLWHQITTVVILRQNMRQNIQSARDGKFRQALENMRYKACTTQDIQFLKTLIAGHGPDKPKLAQKRFRHVSVITARNAHKDHLNELGARRFANDHNIELHSFRSIDKWSNVDKLDKYGKCKRSKLKRNIVNPHHNTNDVTGKMQEILWDLHPNSTEKLPGTLKLCIGMPVLIKKNEATECCVTNGAEATVVGWQTSMSPQDHETLNVLFVKLNSPPRSIQIQGLPNNVVPLTRHTKTIECIFPNDHVACIERSQIMILPNFAMTDYASQGRTRLNNVVDLSNCRNHQSYYTCLSRSSSADGTIIVQGFDTSKITGGASGELRQEFRELELLDDITTKRYNSTLPKSVIGHRRHDLIHSFQSVMGTSYVPKHTHNAIKWSKEDSFCVTNTNMSSDWKIISNKNKNKNKQSYTTKNLNIVPIDNVIGNKHDLPGHEYMQSNVPCKKMKLQANEEFPPVDTIYTGINWDSIDYSCAYDAFMAIMYMLWRDNPRHWTTYMSKLNTLMSDMTAGFDKTLRYGHSMQMIRNSIRAILNEMHPTLFPWGQKGAAASDVCDILTTCNDCIANVYTICTSCNSMVDSSEWKSHMIYDTISDHPYDTSKWLFDKLTHKMTHDLCNNAQVEIHIRNPPKMIFFNMQQSDIRINKHISIIDHNGKRHIWELKSIIYHGGWHFTCVTIDTHGNVWYNDSKSIANHSKHAGHINDLSELDLQYCNERKAEIVLYAYNTP